MRRRRQVRVAEAAALAAGQMAGDVALVAAVPQGRGVAEKAHTGRSFVDAPTLEARGRVGQGPAETRGRVR